MKDSFGDYSYFVETERIGNAARHAWVRVVGNGIPCFWVLKGRERESVLLLRGNRLLCLFLLISLETFHALLLLEGEEMMFVVAEGRHMAAGVLDVAMK